MHFLTTSCVCFLKLLADQEIIKGKYYTHKWYMSYFIMPVTRMYELHMFEKEKGPNSNEK